MKTLLALVIPFLVLVAAAAAACSKDDDSGSSTRKTESYESIRVYPSERRAIRYYDGEREEYEY